MGLLDWAVPAAGVFNQRKAGQQQGQMDAYLFQRKREEEDRQAQQEALQMQLLQTQINKANEGPLKPAAAAGFGTDEAGYLGYLKKVQEASNPQRSPTPTWQDLGYPSFEAWQKDQQAGKGGDKRPKWQQEGYPSFDEWRKDQTLGKGGVGGQPTEGERRAGALLTTARDAFPILQKATPPGLIENSLSKVGPGNAALSTGRQQSLQAGAQFYRSYLYIVSGATVNPQEAEEAAKTFTPQFGDKPGTVARKRQAQKEMLKSMEEAAGRAMTIPPAGQSQTPSDPISKAYSADNPFAPGLRAAGLQ